MESTDRGRRSYVPPRLTVYGRLEELTLTANDNMNKNDPVQGNLNLKT
ncbi:MAG TPA: lasso RiPP family leader peptide-containing protein [Longimicrobium sp.]